jgi:dGTPase
MLTNIFKALEENYITSIQSMRLLPEFTDRLIRNEKDPKVRARLVCDYMSGMTDSFAIRNFKRLFDSDYSSINDIV